MPTTSAKKTGRRRRLAVVEGPSAAATLSPELESERARLLDEPNEVARQNQMMAGEIAAAEAKERQQAEQETRAADFEARCDELLERGLVLDDLLRRGLIQQPTLAEVLARAGMTEGEWEAQCLLAATELKRRAEAEARYDAELRSAALVASRDVLLRGGEWLLEKRSRAAAGRAKGAAAARASPVLADLRAQRAQEKAARYARAVDWQRSHPRGRPHQLAKHLGVSRRTLRRILRGR